jgi:peroxiredoxin
MKINLDTLKVKAGGIAFLVLLCLLVPLASSATIGDAAPDFSLPTLTGEKVTLGAFKGKAVLLNFWASWCTPCREELPELQKMYQKYHKQGFEVIGINIDKKQANAEKFVQRFALSFPVVLDPDSSTISKYEGRAMPTSYLIDRQGMIRQVFFGFNQKKLPDMEKAVVEAMNETAK